MTEIEYCQCCLQELDDDPFLKELYEIICEFYINSGLPYIGCDDAAIRELEYDGYIVSTEFTDDFIAVLPIGIWFKPGKCLFCKDPEHF